MSDLASGEPKEIRGPQVGIDPQDKKTKVPVIVCQHLFDRPDISDIPDRLNLDRGIFLRVIGVFNHCFAPIVRGVYIANLYIFIAYKLACCQEAKQGKMKKFVISPCFSVNIAKIPLANLYT